MEDSFKGVFETNQGSRQLCDRSTPLAIQVCISGEERFPRRCNTRHQIRKDDASNDLCYSSRLKYGSKARRVTYIQQGVLRFIYFVIVPS